MSFKDKNKFAKWLFRKRGYMSDNKFATELGFSRNTTGGWMYRYARDLRRAEACAARSFGMSSTKLCIKRSPNPTIII